MLKGDGSDEWRELQTYIDSTDNIVLPTGRFHFSKPLVFSGPSSRYRAFKLIGPSEDSCALIYTGPAPEAITFDHCAYFQVNGITFSGTGEKFATVGLRLDGPLNMGTQTMAGTFDHCRFEKFETGVAIGGKAASSEIDFHQCVFQLNSIGVETFGYNTLNIRFVLCGWAGNFYGLALGHRGVSEGVQIEGGHTSNNSGADIYAKKTFGNLLISKVRAEVRGFFLQAEGSLSITRISDCTLTDSLPNGPYPSHEMLHLYHGITSIERCKIDGDIGFYGGNGQVRVTDCSLVNSYSDNMPVFNSDRQNYRIYSSGNWLRKPNGEVVMLPDATQIRGRI